MNKPKKSLITESHEIQIAIELVVLGARMQVLESETSLSRERLLNLYKEIKGVSPPKGMLPFSTDWFLTWHPGIHSSLFINIYRYLVEHTDAKGVVALIKAYQLYLEQSFHDRDQEPVLSITRAWTLLRFMNMKMLSTTPCTLCGGHFVVDSMDLHDGFACGLCKVPSRAGKTIKLRDEASALAARA